MQVTPHFLDGLTLEKNVTRFWLVRHAVVDEQANKTLYGSLDVGLSEKSLKDHAHILQTLSSFLPHAQEDLWLSSPLSRASKTAEAVEKAGGYHHDLKIEKDFIEQSLGDWNGVTFEEFSPLPQEKIPPFWSLAASERPPHGESMEDVLVRVSQTLEKWSETNPSQDMVVFTHGGAIRMALAYALSIPAENALFFSIQNLSVSIIEKIDGYWRVIAVNIIPGASLLDNQKVIYR